MDTDPLCLVWRECVSHMSHTIYRRHSTLCIWTRTPSHELFSKMMGQLGLFSLCSISAIYRRLVPTSVVCRFALTLSTKRMATRLKVVASPCVKTVT
jgi:hypothetical protein